MAATFTLTLTDLESAETNINHSNILDINMLLHRQIFDIIFSQLSNHLGYWLLFLLPP